MLFHWTVIGWLACTGASSSTESPVQDSTSSSTTDSSPPLDTTDTADTADTASEPRTYEAGLEADGSLLITVSGHTYTVTTTFSDPDPGVDWRAPGQTGSGWTSTRSLVLEADRILLQDTLQSTSEQDLGLVIRHRIHPPEAPESVRIAGSWQRSVEGGSTNPSTLLTLPGSQLGTVAGDAASWVRFEAQLTGQDIEVGLDGLHLPPGGEHTLTLVLYPLEGGDYWHFINRARIDFAPQVTVPAWEFGPSAKYWDTRGALEPYLDRREIGVGAALAFLDYDNAWMAQGSTIAEQRDDYLEEATEALAAIHAVDPDLVVLGELEGIFTQLTVEQSAELIDLLPQAERWIGYPKTLTSSQQALLESWELRELDSVPLGEDELGFYELYERSGASLIALMTYPEVGTSALENLEDQVRFTLEEVGANGFFLDGGGPANGFLEGPGSDGITAVVDPDDGSLVETRRDYRLTLSEALVPLLQEAVNQGHTVAANGYAFTPELNAEPILRFMETGGSFNPLEVDSDGRPLDFPAFRTGHLGVPMALGNVPALYGADDQAAEFVMRDVISRLAHGLLYAGYNTEIPEEGPGAGRWDALNAMFPITPTELGPGWVIGQERTVTTVSGTWAWNGEGQPQAKCFGLNGALTNCEDSQVTETSDGWLVDVTLDDWDQLAVIDADPPDLPVVALWAMEASTSGPVEVLVDSVGERNIDQVLAAPNYSDVDPPEGLAFTTGWDGMSTGLYLADPGFLDVGAWTLEAWYRRATSDSAGCFLGNGHANDYAGISRVCVDADGTVQVKLVGDTAGASGNPSEILDIEAPDDDGWHHFALTWQDGVAQGFVDGARAGTPLPTTFYAGRLLTDYAYLTLGFANDTVETPGAFWSGDLDGIRLTEMVLEPEVFLTP